MQFQYFHSDSKYESTSLSADQLRTDLYNYIFSG